jgi:hypothetical protein
MFLAGVVGLAALGAGSAHAAFSTFFGQDRNGSGEDPMSVYARAAQAYGNFLGANQYAFQDFESAPLGAPGDAGLSISVGSVTATLKGLGEVRNTPDSGRFSVSGNSGDDDQGAQYWEARATPSGSTFELSFDTAIQKFGFFGIDIGDFSGSLTLELLDVGGVARNTVTLPSQALSGTGARGSVLFFGFETETPAEYFRGIRFRTTGMGASTDVFGFDMFTAVAAPNGPVTPVSLPGSLALTGAALAGLALVRRRG